jgi:hypothetical protein
MGSSTRVEIGADVSGSRYPGQMRTVRETPFGSSPCACDKTGNLPALRLSGESDVLEQRAIFSNEPYLGSGADCRPIEALCHRYPNITHYRVSAMSATTLNQGGAS